MARLITAGFEVKHLTTTQSPPRSLDGYISNGGGFAIDTSIFRSGNAALSCTPPINFPQQWNVGPNSLVSNGTTIYGRTYFRWNGVAPSGGVGNITTVFAVGGTNAYCRMNGSGQLELWNGAVSKIGNSSNVLTPNQWYRLELAKKVVGSGSTDYLELLIDGISIASSNSLSGLTQSTAVIYVGALENINSGPVFWFDDIALNDNTGASQTSWPGSGKVVLLVPVSTNGSPATLWTDNNNSQTNMWDGVNNTPPSGTSAATSPAHMYIKHGGGAAGTTDEFDANMTTYANAGIGASDTVNLIQYIVIVGEESATGTKLLAIKGVSNPVVAQGSSFDVYAISGAQGAYPTNWTIKMDGLAIQYNPTITIASSPVFGVVRPETASRVASVCGMFMYVDYTPPTTPTVGSESDAIPAKSSQIVSVNRASFY